MDQARAGSYDAWWRSAVVYQVYPRSFADGDGDGVGDLRGLLQRVDHLARLGVDVVWLSPVYRSPMDDNGYDIADYQDVDPLFGTLADLDAVIGALHERGIKVLMDLVVNHTSDEHPWFTESRSSRDNPKRDWYWWRPPREGVEPGQPGAEPTNWGSFFSGPAWEYDEHTGEYYLHLFSRKQPDLNWENPEVRRAVYTMMRWWLDRGVDGFRMDVINMISKEPSLPDGPVRPGERFAVLEGLAINGPKLHELLQEMHREVFAGVDRPLLLVGEMPNVSVEQARLHTTPSRAELDMVFQFEHVQVDRGETKWDPLPFDVRRLRDVLFRWQEGLEDDGWNSLYWNNHDQPRVVSRYGAAPPWQERSAKLLATVLHLLRGTPYVYQGEELGMTNVPFDSIEDFEDIESVNYFREAVARGEKAEDVLASLRAMSRDNARSPMQWSAEPNAGFTAGRPWRPVHPNHVEINAAAQYDDPDSVFEHYRRLIALRHEEPAVSRGTFEALCRDHACLFAYARAWQDVELVVVANFSAETVKLPEDLQERTWGTDLLLTNLDTGGRGGRAATVTRPSPDLLEPWEARVLRSSG